MTTGRPNLCIGCLFFTRDGALSDATFPTPPACAAFPKGIPVQILDGTVDHRQPFPGDGKIVFIEQIPGTASRYDASRKVRGR